MTERLRKGKLCKVSQNVDAHCFRILNDDFLETPTPTFNLYGDERRWVGNNPKSYQAYPPGAYGPDAPSLESLYKMSPGHAQLMEDYRKQFPKYGMFMRKIKVRISGKNKLYTRALLMTPEGMWVLPLHLLESYEL